MLINEFVGNNKIIEKVSLWIKEGKLPHAIVIEGAHGLGKSTLAELIAMSMLCKSSEKSPCMHCSSCKKAVSHVHPDIISLKPKESRVTIGVESVRELREQAYVSPNESDYKIYLIENVDSMTPQAQNALLKILEEPPKHVLFIMTCVSCLSLLQTVRSRVQIITLSNVDLKDGIEFIQNKNSEASLEDIKKAMEFTSGNIGAALDMLCDNKFCDAKKVANEIALAIISSKEIDLLTSTSLLLKEKNILPNVISELLIIFRGSYLYATKSKVVHNENQLGQRIYESLTLKQIISIIDFLNDSKKYSDNNVNNNLLITWLVSNLYKMKGRDFCQK